MDSGTINIWKRLQCGLPKMQRSRKLRVSEVNPHLICVLCGGYYIDATTITECLHTFCKTCIVGYLEASKHCPVCDNLVHKTKPHLRLRPDHTLQDLVYKLVPGLFQDEMKKRREFYKEEIEQGKLGDNGIPEERERIVYSADEMISVVLELSSDGQPPINPSTRSAKHKVEAADRRYLQCPANITIYHLKKFIRMKFNLSDRYQVDFYHTDESLHDHYTLVDVAYIYSWRRQGPLRLYYTIFTNPAKKFKVDIDDLVPMETDLKDQSDSRVETSGYISDDFDKSHDRSTDSGVSLGDSSAISDRKGSSGSDSSHSDSVFKSAYTDILDKEKDLTNKKDLTKKVTKHSKDDTNKDKLHSDLEMDERVFHEGNDLNKSPKQESKSKAKLPNKTIKKDKQKSINSGKVVDKCSVNKTISVKEDNVKTNEMQIEDVKIQEVTVKEIKVPDMEMKEVKGQEVKEQEMKVNEIKEQVLNTKELKVKEGKIVQTKEKEVKLQKVKEQEVKEQEVKEQEVTMKEVKMKDEKIKDIAKDNYDDSNEKSEKEEIKDKKESFTKSNIVSASTDTDIDKVENSHKEIISAKPSSITEASNFKHKESHKVSESNTTEISTCTSPIPLDTVSDSVSVCKHTKTKLTDDDISEPVVSSTQNTQGCQTEPPETSSEAQSQLVDTNDTKVTLSSSRKATVDVSCETENFELSREISVESVSVSTETEIDHTVSESTVKLSVECPTDAPELTSSETRSNKSVDCSTDFDSFPSANNNKRKALSVDCSTGMDDFNVSSSKRKLVDSATVIDSKLLKTSKKTDTKTTKRSFSYGGLTSTPKPAYLAQPLSPTKITLKFTSPKSPIQTMPKSPSSSRAEPTGFQSQYQSFVMDLPNKTYEFHDESSDSPNTPSSKTTTTFYKHQNFSTTPTNHYSSAPKKSQTKSGRPRGRPPKNRSLETYVEPPHKEKKHKSRSHSPKHRRHSDKVTEKEKHSLNHGEKRKSTHSPPRDNSKQSSSGTPYNWINKICMNPKQSSDRKSQKSKTEQSDKPAPELKIPKQFLYFSNGQYTLASESTLAALKQSSPVSPTRTVSAIDTQPNSYGDKQTSAVKVKEKKAESKQRPETPKLVIKTETRTPTTISKPLTKPCKVTSKNSVQPVIKTDSNQNKIMTVSSSINLKTSVSSSDNKHDPTPTSSVKCPEYRHQSPFFASISGAKLAQSPGMRTPLNIPNLSSHFPGTHHLYAHARYSADRLAPPSNLFRSFSMNEKSLTSPVVSKFQDKQRLDALPSPCGYLAPYPAAYLGLSFNSHVISSLPPAASPKGYSPDSTRSPTHTVSEINTNIGNSPSQSSAKTVVKSSDYNRKGKGKSIDNIISAITEMRAKQEEQLNGIDLSTKSSRQTDKSSSPNNEEKLDKFAFTDEDEIGDMSMKSTNKRENAPLMTERNTSV